MGYTDCKLGQRYKRGNVFNLSERYQNRHIRVKLGTEIIQLKVWTFLNSKALYLTICFHKTNFCSITTKDCGMPGVHV